MRHDAGGTAWPEVVRQAMAHCAKHELALLVVDTFDRWTGLRGDAENAAGAVNEALEPLKYAAAAGLAVLLVSHQRKSSGEFGEAVRGSNALTGGVDVVVELERPSRTLELGSHSRVLRAVSRFRRPRRSSTSSSTSTASLRSTTRSRRRPTRSASVYSPCSRIGAKL